MQERTTEDRQEGILLHMLGLSRSEKAYRDRYVSCGALDTNWGLLMAMESEGLIRRVRSPGFLPAGDVTFVTTPEGRSRAFAAKATAARAVPVGRRRYQQWLRLSDVAPDLTFGDWLRSGAYR